jgi:polar amino acid transport system substrate-binding protein
MVCFVTSAFAQDEKITTIHIVTPSWEDYTNEDGTGLWFEILRAVYEPVGIEMTYEIMPWKRAMKKLETHEADAMLGEYANEEVLTPRYPLDIERTAVVFKKEKFTWDGLKSLEGKSIVWLRGYDYHEAAELESIRVKWHEVDNYIQAWRMLEKDRIDFYMDDRDDMEQTIEDEHIDMTPYQIETAWITNVYVAFAKTKKSEKLAEIYDQKIPELLESGELKKLFEEWEALFPPFKPEDE